MIKDAFNNIPLKTPPIWFMRQAGRYLPEYLKIKREAGSFLNLCYNPKLAAKIAMQPIYKFDFDAAILFSDILVVPKALGIKVEFIENKGPKLSKITSEYDVDCLDISNFHKNISKIYETVKLTRKILPKNKDLIGFCGAPWTLLTYMIGNSSNTEQKNSRLFAYAFPELIKRLLVLLTDILVEYLFKQAQNGAKILKIFDSWAGSLADDEFDHLVVKPTHILVKNLKEKLKIANILDVKIIAFPKGAGEKYIYYSKNIDIDCLAIDSSTSLEWARNNINSNICLQGNLDPLLLATGTDKLKKRVNHICNIMTGCKFIFNLGHGVIPETPISNIQTVINIIRNR